MLFVDCEERAPLEFFEVRKPGLDLVPCAGDIDRRRQITTQLAGASRLAASAEQEHIDFYPFTVHRSRICVIADLRSAPQLTATSTRVQKLPTGRCGSCSDGQSGNRAAYIASILRLQRGSTRR